MINNGNKGIWGFPLLCMKQTNMVFSDKKMTQFSPAVVVRLHYSVVTCCIAAMFANVCSVLSNYCSAAVLSVFSCFFIMLVFL